MFKRVDIRELVIISDFDGTISKQDTNDLIFKTFGNSNNRYIEELYSKGKIGTREGMIEHYKEIKLQENEYNNFILQNVDIDEGFRSFYDKVNDYKIPFVIVSGGFLNCIKLLFEREKIILPQVYANQLIFKNDKIEINFFRNIEKCNSGFGSCGNCKLKCLEECKNMNKTVIFIGDGLTDRCIAENADLVFAKSALAQYCDEKGVSYIRYQNFNDIKQKLFTEILN